jgi:hypothetical protein
MRRRIMAAVLCLVLTITPAISLGGGSDCADSSYWSALVHQENSITASLLYIPYLILVGPVRIVDGIVNPKPTSQATVPPAAHKVK